MSQFVVLLSAGMDSSVNFYKAMQEGEILLALTFNYGQRAALKEIERARAICDKFKVPHRVIDIPFVKEFGKSSLTDTRLMVPVSNEVRIDDFENSKKTAQSVWVPNRNGIFLNIAAGFAEALGAQFIIPGFNKEEATTFPDNSVDFIKVTEESFTFSTSNSVKIKCWTQDLNKSEIVKLGQQLQVDWSLIWPCYFMNEKWCGQCESCLRSKRAFRSGGVEISQYFQKV